MVEIFEGAEEVPEDSEGAEEVPEDSEGAEDSEDSEEEVLEDSEEPEEEALEDSEEPEEFEPDASAVEYPDCSSAWAREAAFALGLPVDNGCDGPSVSTPFAFLVNTLNFAAALSKLAVAVLLRKFLSLSPVPFTCSCPAGDADISYYSVDTIHMKN